MPRVTEMNPYARAELPCNCQTRNPPHNQGHPHGGQCSRCGHDFEHCFCKPVPAPMWPDDTPTVGSTNTVTSDGVATALQAEHDKWRLVTGDPNDFHGQPIGTLSEEINTVYDMMMAGAAAASSYGKLRGAVIQISHSNLILARDTMAYIVQIDGVPVTGTFDGEKTTYDWTPQEPSTVTVTLDGVLQYKWLAAADQGSVPISQEAGNSLEQKPDGLYVSAAVDTGLPPAPTVNGAYALVVTNGVLTWVDANLLAVQP